MDIPILSWLERLPRYLLHLPGFQNIFHINYHLKKFNILYHSKKIKYQCKELAENFDLVKDVHEISPEDKKTIEDKLEKVHIVQSIILSICPVHVIWTERRMTNLMLNVCFDFFSRNENRN